MICHDLPTGLKWGPGCEDSPVVGTPLPARPTDAGDQFFGSHITVVFFFEHHQGPSSNPRKNACLHTKSINTYCFCGRFVDGLFCAPGPLVTDLVAVPVQGMWKVLEFASNHDGEKTHIFTQARNPES